MAETIIQAIIVAAITAAATGYVNGKIMETKINGMKDTLARLERDIQSITERLYEWSGHIGWVDIQRHRHLDDD